MKAFPIVISAVFGMMMASAPAGAQTVTEAAINPRAIELFERDQRLMRWALGRFDADQDGIISAAEAHSGALAFKQIADGDGDGRVTPYEFDRAREFIIARF